MAKIKLSKTTVDALPIPATGYALVWDTDLTGFGVRITESGLNAHQNEPVFAQ